MKDKKLKINLFVVRFSIQILYFLVKKYQSINHFSETAMGVQNDFQNDSENEYVVAVKE